MFLCLGGIGARTSCPADWDSHLAICNLQFWNGSSSPASLISLWILTSLFNQYCFTSYKSCFLSFLCSPFKFLPVSEFTITSLFCVLSWQDLASSSGQHAHQVSILPLSCISSPGHVLFRWRHFFSSLPGDSDRLCFCNSRCLVVSILYDFMCIFG